MRENKKDKMQLLKEELYKMLDAEPVSSERVLALSEELDKIINEYNPKSCSALFTNPAILINP